MSSTETSGLSMSAVTIAREYGSGGGEIARRLAARLGWQLLDHEIVAEVARSTDLSESDAQRLDEHGMSFVTRLLTGLAYAMPEYSLSTPENPLRAYRRTVRRVLESAAALGHVVIVGRGGQLLLAWRHDVLHVAVIAPLPARLTYVLRREELDGGPAQNRIQQQDQARKRALQEEYGQTGEDPHLYDLVINTAVLDLDSAVDLVALALERKGQRLGLPDDALGPGAGLAPYPTPPAT